MNRVIKKALSFISAVAIGVSTLAAGAVSAQAASSIKFKQVIANTYDIAIDMDGAALFVSNTDSGTVKKDSKIVMLTNKCKKVTIKNTIGFDKLYTVGTMYANYEVNSFENARGCVILGVGKKYSALLKNGKYLANGKLFDNVVVSASHITANLSKTTYVYDFNGKQLTKVSKANLTCIDYDKSTKTFVFRGERKPDEYTCNFYLIRNGKTIKTFKNLYYGTGTTKKGGKTYFGVWNSDEGKTYYYSMNGKKLAKEPEGESTTVKETKSSRVVREFYWDKQNLEAQILLKDEKTGKTLKSYTVTPYSPVSYTYFSDIHSLDNGKFYFISISKTQKYGCILF